MKVRARGGRVPRRLLAVAAVGVVLVLVLAWPGRHQDVRQPQPAARSTPPRTAASPSGPSGGTSGLQRREVIAAAPMLDVPPLGAQSRAEAAEPAGLLEVPAPLLMGPVGVPAGFSRTAEGAVGQLAAIGTTVFNNMSLPQTEAVYWGWALPGGVGADRWELTRQVQVFLTAAEMGSELDGTATVTAAPVAGLVKGVDGPSWVLACVLLEVRATISVEARIGYGHCERMQWQPTVDDPTLQGGEGQAGRWMIGPGSPPAAAPSTWPGSELSRQAGWRTWTEATPEGLGR